MTPVRTLAAALLLSLTSAVRANDLYHIKTVDAAPPTELAEPVRKLIAERCVEFLAGGDEPIVEVWFRKEAPGDAVEVQIQNGLTYREVPETTLMGALRVAGDFTDYRRQKIAPGVYTLRLAFQPPTDDHQGSAPYTEFFLACPAGEDVKPDAIAHKALEELSIKATGGKHPAVFLLFPGKNTTDEPKLVEKGGGCRVLMVKQDVRVGETKTVMGVGLTLAGVSPKAPEKP